MTPKEFIEISAKLVAHTGFASHEARHRTAVSRAYYGAFHAVSEFLQDCELTVRRNAYGHQDAIDYLRKSGDVRARLISGMVDDLRQKRILADYRLEAATFESVTLAKDCVEIASEVLTLLAECRRGIDSFREGIQ